MSFSILASDEKIPDGWLEPGEKATMAVITIGDFSERFLLPLDYWSIEDYSSQWLLALSGLQRTKSAFLITEMYDPQSAHFIKCWSLQSVGNERFDIINSVLFMDQISNFDTANLHKYVQHIIDDKEDVSHWLISKEELDEWLKVLEFDLASRKEYK